MNRKSRHSSVALLLIALLLANSSYALEIIAHDSHAHDPVGHAMEMDMTAGETMTTDTAGSDDCLCDEICCLSSMNLTAADTGSQSLVSVSCKAGRPDLYQSVFLDPYTEPPTV